MHSQYRERSIVPGDSWQRQTNGLYLPGEGGAKQRYGHRPIAIDLFSGAGGFSCGIIQAGFRVVAACDNDCDATITYLINLGSYPVDVHFVEPGDKERLERALKRSFKSAGGDSDIVTMPMAGSGWISHEPDVRGVSHFWFGDIRKVTGGEILVTLGLEKGDIDLVVGGPPCQGFSKGGRRNVMDPRNSLVFDFARLVLEIRPKTMAMENVPGIASMLTPEGVPVLDALCHLLEDGEFGTYDALRRSLAMTAGVGAAIAKKPQEKANGKKTKRPATKGQAALPL